MGIMDLIFGRKNRAQKSKDTSRQAQGLDIQTDEQKAASRSKMEAELEENRAGREARAAEEAAEKKDE